MSFPGSYLGKWLVVVSVASMFNTAQCFIDPTAKLTGKIYANKPKQVTSLTSRMFGTWTALSAIIRLYGAYNLKDARFVILLKISYEFIILRLNTSYSAYFLTLSTFAVALGHFLSELFYYRTADIKSPGVISPLIVASKCLSDLLLTDSRFC